MTEMKHLNYNGDTTHLVGQFIKAPINRTDHVFEVVDAHYDRETNKTRLDLKEAHE